MTRRTILIAAGAAAGLAAVGLAASPLLAAGHRPRPAVPAAHAGPAVSPAIEEAATSAATRAAVRALACPPAPTPTPAPTGPPVAGTRPVGWCGQLTVTRSETLCASPGRCDMQLVGIVDTAAAGTAIVALTVTVTRRGGGWQATGVRS